MATKITVKNHGSIRLEWENPGEVKLQDASGKDYDLGKEPQFLFVAAALV
jgi:hypothetical protein